MKLQTAQIKFHQNLHKIGVYGYTAFTVHLIVSVKWIKLYIYRDNWLEPGAVKSRCKIINYILNLLLNKLDFLVDSLDLKSTKSRLNYIKQTKPLLDTI